MSMATGVVRASGMPMTTPNGTPSHNEVTTALVGRVGADVPDHFGLHGDESLGVGYDAVALVVRQRRLRSTRGGDDHEEHRQRPLTSGAHGEEGEFEPHQIENLWVHDNTVTLNSGTTGPWDVTGDDSYHTSHNNRFDFNKPTSLRTSPSTGCTPAVPSRNGSTAAKTPAAPSL